MGRFRSLTREWHRGIPLFSSHETSISHKDETFRQIEASTAWLRLTLKPPVVAPIGYSFSCDARKSHATFERRSSFPLCSFMEPEGCSFMKNVFGPSGRVVTILRSFRESSDIHSGTDRRRPSQPDSSRRFPEIPIDRIATGIGIRMGTKDTENRRDL